ncbi:MULTISPECIES: heme exporter protein CcmD [Thalassospira]|uniref:Heme exporter protein D n=1 Tax=Thalassospira profundimaris TaxID=502049 RepID=A0A367VJ71_9PROT|nr:MULTISPECIES: heme exporter protein CcmD [Thalassospira]KZB71082.1 heme exporter protein CcmD [Thalassospira sp. MCCC 1A01148]MBS8273348.1 heme exporter protein CcmD [Thalassospira tepidiphila]RCK25268.1 cytochrome C biogenesis protein CycX [Thalassospira profundimaris]
MSEFFSMGGYGSYIWASYGLTALAMIALLISTLRGLRSSETERDQLETVLQSRRPRRTKKSPTAS